MVCRRFRRLVGLRPQRLGESADRVEFTEDTAQLGVVAEGDDGADAALVPVHRVAVDDEGAVARQVHLVACLAGGCEFAQCLGQGVEGDRPGRGKAEQAACLVVDDVDLR